MIYQETREAPLEKGSFGSELNSSFWNASALQSSKMPTVAVDLLQWHSRSNSLAPPGRSFYGFKQTITFKYRKWLEAAPLLGTR